MRLMDVDAYIKEHEEQYKYSDHYETEYFWNAIINAPTIDAVPVEEAASIIYSAAGVPPCKTDFFEENDAITCQGIASECCMIDSYVECWERMLRIIARMDGGNE